MRGGVKIFWAFIAGIAVTLIAPLVVLALGWFDVGADVKPGIIERTIAPWAMDVSVEKRAYQEKNPCTGDPEAVAEGFKHYRETCVLCHGAKSVPPLDMARGFNPGAPSLGVNQEDMSDGEVFWIAKHGIRMTGMPAFGVTHTDEQIWKIVAFMRTIPDLTAEQEASLQQRVGGDSHEQVAGEGATGEKVR
jgi:mono/diheme cytochrome c family protein